MSELGQIRDRLTKLETQNKERWDAHDQKSKIIWGEIKQDIKDVSKKIDIIATRKDNCMKEAKGYTNKVVGFTLGIPTVILTILSIVWVAMRIIDG